MNLGQDGWAAVTKFNAFLQQTEIQQKHKDKLLTRERLQNSLQHQIKLKNNVKKKEQEKTKYFDQMIIKQDIADKEYLEKSKEDHHIKVL